MFRFTIRDLLWLMVVAAVAVGWWVDQDRIRRHEAEMKAAQRAVRDEREKLRLQVQRLQALPLAHAEAALRVTEAEHAQVVEIKNRSPSAVSEGELRRVQSQLEVARLNVEQARAKKEFGPATNPPPKPLNSN